MVHGSKAMLIVILRLVFVFQGILSVPHRPASHFNSASLYRQDCSPSQGQSSSTGSRRGESQQPGRVQILLNFRAMFPLRSEPWPSTSPDVEDSTSAELTGS